MTESDPDYKFIELNRTFHELSKYTNEDDELDLSHAFHVGERLSWSDLIERYRVIILSEAGSGKTAEIRNIALDLRAQGKSAFFIRLEHVPNDFEDGFEVGTFEEFETWLASNDEGWLLLDSVDEARLRNPGDFALAVKKLGRRIATAKDRSHIVVTDAPMRGAPKLILRFASLICLSRLPRRRRRKTRLPTSTTRSRTLLRLRIDRQKSPSPSLRSSHWTTCLVLKSRHLLVPVASVTPKPSLRPSSAPMHGPLRQDHRI